MRIIAIDPGYERLGIAVLQKEIREKETLLHSECFQTDKALPHSERLARIGKRITEVIAEFKPDALAAETLFLSTNQKTAMHVAEARGVILYEASKNKLDVHEYTPLQIKVAVTGYGKSDKAQVTAMTERLIRMEKKKRHDDEYDAIAVGLTCFASLRPPVTM